jgi:hypothetical protein
LTGAYIGLRGKEVVHEGAQARQALLHTNVREGFFDILGFPSPITRDGEGSFVPIDHTLRIEQE